MSDPLLSSHCEEASEGRRGNLLASAAAHRGHSVRNPRRTLRIWAVSLVAVVVLSQAFTYGLARYAQRMRTADYRTYLAAANQRLEQFDFPGALAQVEEAKRRAPDVAEPYVVSGDTHYRLKHWYPAIADYARAIERGSNDEGVRLNTVWAYIELKRYDEAVAFGAYAIAEGFTSPSLPRYIAEANLRAGKIAEAIPYLEKALEGYPNDLYLLDRLRQAYRTAGRTDAAETLQARITDIQASLNQFHGEQ